MKPNNGGQAFPIPIGSAAPHSWNQMQVGMTLRDYFATKIMQSFCVATEEYGDLSKWNFATIAEAAYRAADAMLAERLKEE